VTFGCAILHAGSKGFFRSVLFLFPQDQTDLNFNFHHYGREKISLTMAGN